MSDIATFPRKALTDPFFLRGLKVGEDDLIDAMNVADDALLHDRRARGLKERCKDDLALLDRIESVSDAKQRCDLVWRLIAGDDTRRIDSDVYEQAGRAL